MIYISHTNSRCNQVGHVGMWRRRQRCHLLTYKQLDNLGIVRSKLYIVGFVSSFSTGIRVVSISALGKTSVGNRRTL